MIKNHNSNWEQLKTVELDDHNEERKQRITVPIISKSRFLHLSGTHSEGYEQHDNLTFGFKWKLEYS